MNDKRWHDLMQRCGIRDGTSAFDALSAAYAQRHRHYHTTRHIDHCLSELDLCRHLAEEPDEVELALWFHDAIYRPYASGNEVKSARWACEFLEANDMPHERVARVREHILATRHQSVAVATDSKLTVDADLAILGADRAQYALFEMNIRKEYRWIPDLLYRRKRAEILQSFLHRYRIYATDFFAARYESRARENLAAAIALHRVH